MRFLLNGEPVERSDTATIEELVVALRLSSESTLVEHNGVALRRRDWPNERLRGGDRVEILRVAAGG
jgi:thiamine biosynthesis protein ThiS